MLKTTDDLRIKELRELRSPEEVIREFPRTDAATRTVLSSRHALHNIIHGTDDPSSIGRSASHGCIRIPVFAAKEFSEMTPNGTVVIVHSASGLAQGNGARTAQR